MNKRGKRVFCVFEVFLLVSVSFPNSFLMESSFVGAEVVNIPGGFSGVRGGFLYDNNGKAVYDTIPPPPALNIPSQSSYAEPNLASYNEETEVQRAMEGTRKAAAATKTTDSC